MAGRRRSRGGDSSHSGQGKQCRFFILYETTDFSEIAANECLDSLSGSVASANEDNFRWVPPLKAQLEIVLVFGDNSQALRPGIGPNFIVIGGFEPNSSDVERIWEYIL